MSKPLEYLRLSPVRGQLEPYDPKSPMGWRYIQTTDTLNELKILIPPGTAAMYEQLLKLEKYEITKKSVNWPRIIEIRRLKDRMVRKCQKLARETIPPSDSLSPFQTCIASKDFRVKEMERWFREQQKRANAVAIKRASKEPASNIPANAGSNPTNPQYSSGVIIMQPAKFNLQGFTTPIPKPELGLHTRVQANVVKLERSASLPVSQDQGTCSSCRPSVISPPPIPILLRGQRLQLGLDEELGQVESALDDSEPPGSSTNDSPPPSAPNEVSAEQTSLAQSSSQSSGDEMPSYKPNVTAVRRRSCIKRTSMSEIGTKTVSWADDHGGRASRYISAAHDAQASGRRWEEIREIYLEQISGLEALQSQVQEGIESLKMESEYLQHVDDTIRRQREQLRYTFDEFERKQETFNEKVKEALAQADDIISRQGLCKNTLLITHE